MQCVNCQSVMSIGMCLKPQVFLFVLVPCIASLDALTTRIFPSLCLSPRFISSLLISRPFLFLWDLESFSSFWLLCLVSASILSVTRLAGYLWNKLLFLFWFSSVLSLHWRDFWILGSVLYILNDFFAVFSSSFWKDFIATRDVTHLLLPVCMKTLYEIWPCYFFILHFNIKLSFLIFWNKM